MPANIPRHQRTYQNGTPSAATLHAHAPIAIARRTKDAGEAASTAGLAERPLWCTRSRRGKIEARRQALQGRSTSGKRIQRKVTEMRHTAVILASAVFFVCWGCRGKAEAAPARDLQTPPRRTEWKLLSGLTLLQGSLDISFDRKLGVVWGERTLDMVHKKSYWLIDLQTGEVEDLLIKFEEKAADIVRGSEDVRFSPDGKHLLISAHYCKSARIFDLSTRKCVVVGGGEYRTILWVGNRLLFESLHSSEIRDVAGKVLEKKLLDNVIASDPTGKKLLVGWPRPMVISPEATILREFGDSACDKETPLLSRSGNWAGVFCKGEDGWAYSVVSTTTDKVYRLRRPWARPSHSQTTAIAFSRWATTTVLLARL